MKKLLIATLVGLFLAGIATSVLAQPLPPGGTILPSGAVSPGGVLLRHIQTSFVANTGLFSGIFDQWVRNSTTNPGWIVYEYQFTNIGPGPITYMSSIDFDLFQMNADVTGPGVSPTVVNRLSYGGLIDGYWFQNPIGSGQSTPLLWFEVNSPYIGSGNTFIQGSGQAAIRTYAPTVPEPTSLAFLGLGLLGLGAGIRRKFKA